MAHGAFEGAAGRGAVDPRRTRAMGSEAWKGSTPAAEVPEPLAEAEKYLAAAQTLDDVRAALLDVTEVVGKSGKTYTKRDLLNCIDAAEQIIRAKQFVGAGMLLATATRALGFYEALKRILERERAKAEAAPVALPRTQETDLLAEAKKRMSRAETFEQIAEALTYVTGTVTSQSGGEYTQANFQKLLQDAHGFFAMNPNVAPEVLLAATTNALGFREALMRAMNSEKLKAFAEASRLEKVRNTSLPLDQRFQAVQSFGELREVLRGVQGLTGGSGVHYNPFQIEQMIGNVERAVQENDPVKVSHSVAATTSAAELRVTVGRIAQNMFAARNAKSVV